MNNELIPNKKTPYFWTPLSSIRDCDIDTAKKDKLCHGQIRTYGRIVDISVPSLTFTIEHQSYYFAFLIHVSLFTAHHCYISLYLHVNGKLLEDFVTKSDLNYYYEFLGKLEPIDDVTKNLALPTVAIDTDKKSTRTYASFTLELELKFKVPLNGISID